MRVSVAFAIGLGRYLSGFAEFIELRLKASTRLNHGRIIWMRRAACHARFGRVEDGRGSLGPMANAPFPIPAHQTGRADFRHPAFRLASPQGIRRDRSGQALEAQNAEFSMNYIECKSTIAAPLHLVPSREEPAQSFKDVLVDATVCLAPRAVAKVFGPASQ